MPRICSQHFITRQSSQLYQETEHLKVAQLPLLIILIILTRSINIKMTLFIYNLTYILHTEETLWTDLHYKPIWLFSIKWLPVTSSYDQKKIVLSKFLLLSFIFSESHHLLQFWDGSQFTTLSIIEYFLFPHTCKM